MKKHISNTLTLIATCALIAALLSSVGCTDNQRAKHYGGSMTINLPPNTKLLNVTYKQDNLWYLTRPATTNDVAETLTFKEKSNMGVFEGTIIFVESIK